MFVWFFNNRWFLSFRSIKGKARHTFLVDAACHEHVIAVVKGRAEPIGINVVVAPASEFAFSPDTMGCLVAYPGTNGAITDVGRIAKACKVLLHEKDSHLLVYLLFVYFLTKRRSQAAGGVPVCLTDLLALTVLTPPGELGFDIAVGNSQRFGVPMGFGGPHAAFIACLDERTFMRLLPGRIVGVTKDANDKMALRLALQTREQHIKREKATSNICTAQALLANMVANYAVYHGPAGVKAIAERVHTMTNALATCAFFFFFPLHTPALANLMFCSAARQRAQRTGGPVL